MATGVGLRQDLPPKGGFDPIDFTKKVYYKKTNGFKILGIVLSIKVAGYIYVRHRMEQNRVNLLEQNDARFAESVFRLAETDRLYLKHLRACRDEERELMKNVPGWEVGTFFGEPIYHKEKRQFIAPPEVETNTLSTKIGVSDYLRVFVYHLFQK